MIESAAHPQIIKDIKVSIYRYMITLVEDTGYLMTGSFVVKTVQFK